MNLSTTRKIDLLASLLGAVILGFAYYLEYQKNLTPCLLCVIERYIFFILILLFLSGGLLKLNNLARRMYHAFVLLIASFGIAVAGRHVWLTLTPPPATHISSCEASLQVLFKYLPLDQALSMIAHGAGDCSKADWHLFYLSLPMWSLLFFVVFALAAVWQIAYRDKESNFKV